MMLTMKLLLSTVGLLAALSCQSQPQSLAPQQINRNGAMATESNSFTSLFFNNNAQIDKAVDELYQKMTVQERAAQMIMVASGETMGFPYETYVKPLLKNKTVANVIFLKGKTTQFKKQAEELNKSTIAGLKPLYACDCEPSLLHYKMIDKPKMQPTAQLKDSLAIKNSIDSITKIMKDIGIHINFAPVADIAINKSVINNRSFSSNPVSIIEKSNYFIRYSQKQKIATAIKHFPGHGAVLGDTHKESVLISGKLSELGTFQKIIKDANPVFVMIGHIAVKNNLDGYNTEVGRNASTSYNIVTKLLKQQIAYKGIITTDAMNMGAATKVANGDWEAVKAGVDLILMPVNPKKLHAQMVAELQTNSALAQSMEQSIKKIIRLKYIQSM